MTFSESFKRWVEKFDREIYPRFLRDMEEWAASGLTPEEWFSRRNSKEQISTQPRKPLSDKENQESEP